MDQKSPYIHQAREDYALMKKEGKEEGLDPWDKRIDDAGCYVENMALRLCHADTGDWRNCLNEMKLFKECWAKNGNPQRVHTIDAE